MPNWPSCTTSCAAIPARSTPALPLDNVVLALRLRTERGELALFSVAAALETAADVTISELVIETFYPADAATAGVLRGE